MPEVAYILLTEDCDGLSEAVIGNAEAAARHTAENDAMNKAAQDIENKTAARENRKPRTRYLRMYGHQSVIGPFVLSAGEWTLEDGDE